MVAGQRKTLPPTSAAEDQRMPQPTLQELMQKSTAFLLSKELPNGRREVEWIFSETLRLTRLELYTRFDMLIGEAEVLALRDRITRRGRREPLAYVLGNQPFRSLQLLVTPAVLVPRPETEELIDLVLADLPNDLPTKRCRILDVGTGSGAIALALKQARPTCTVEGTDISLDALVVARANAEANNLDVRFHHGHLATHVTTPFELVVANLPYIGESERAVCDPELAHEPQIALFAGADGLDLIRPLMADVTRICQQGALWLEHGWQQAEAIAAEATRLGLRSRVHRDGAGKDRFTRVSP